MKWNLTPLSVLFVLFTFILGLIFLLVKIYYWEFIDILVYPSTSFSDFAIEPNQYSNFQIAKHLLISYLDYIKHPIIDFLIEYTGYNIFITITALFGVITCSSLLFFYTNKHNYVALLPVTICCIFIVLAITIDTPVMKWTVDDAFLKYKYEDITGLNHVELLRNEKYRELDEAFHDLEIKYLTGRITEPEYEFENDKIYYIKEEDHAYLNRWIASSTFPEIPLSIRGGIYERLGWSARGNKYAKDTSDEQFEKMREYFDKAISDHKASLKKNSKMIFSYISLFNISMASNKLNAEEIYTKAKSEFTASYLLDYGYIKVFEPKWGGSFYKMKRFSKERRKYAFNQPKLIALGGYEAIYRANNFWNVNDYDNAIKWFNRALLYAPKKTLFKKINDLYKLKKDYTNAIRSLNIGLEFFPDDTLLLALRAMNNVHAKDMTSAIKDADAASKHSIDEYWLLANLGWVYESAGNNKKAVDLYKQSLYLNPDYVYALKRLFYLSYLKAMSYEDVLPYMKHWISIEPKNPEAWVSYADTIEDLEPKKSIVGYEKYLLLVDHENKINLERIKSVKAVLNSIKNMEKTE